MKPATISAMKQEGMLFRECPLVGETRADGVYPAHPNGMQLSRDRFLILYCTRSHRGVDDDMSAVYQLRADAWDGPILAENFISQTANDWDPLGEGIGHVKQHGHPSGFGVPLGAKINGTVPDHAGLFVAMWRQVARARNPQTGWVEDVCVRPDLWEKTSDACWRHFRLNDDASDIEWLTECEPMRPVGHQGKWVSGRDDVAGVIKGFVPAIPVATDCSMWMDLNTACRVGGAQPGSTNSRGVLPSFYQYHRECHRYEWVHTGPLSEWGLYEASVATDGNQFLMMARQGSPAKDPQTGEPRKACVNYFATSDPLRDEATDFRRAEDQPSVGPRTLFTTPDGSFWKFGGSVAHSPYKEQRNPMYMEKIQPEFPYQASDCHLIRDAEADNPGIPLPVWMDFPKLLPHTGGHEQWLLYRMRGIGERYPDDLFAEIQKKQPGEVRPGVPRVRQLTQTEFDHCGIYATKIVYDEDQPPTWTF